MEWSLLFMLILVKCSCTGASFINTPMDTEVCGGTDANLTWVFSNAANQALVQWTVGSTSIARLLGGASFIPEAGYSGRVQNDGNGGLIITSVTSADIGTYKCVVSYSDGTPPAENEVTLNVYSAINTPLQITEVKSGSSVTLSSNLTDTSITYTWTTPNGNDLGTSINAASNGNYTLCISGGRAQCLSPSLSSCVSYEVSGVGPTTTPIMETSTTETSTISYVTDTNSVSPTVNYTKNTNGATFETTEIMETKLSTVSTSLTTELSISTSTTTEPSGLSEELRNIIIIVSSVGGSVVIVVVIVIVLCCKRKQNGNNTRKKNLKKKEFKPDLNYNLQNVKNTQSKQAQTQDNHRKNEEARMKMYNLNTYDYISPNNLGYGGRDIPQNAKNTQSKPAQAQYSYRKNEKARNEVHNLNKYDYISPYDSGYGGREIPYSHGRRNQHYDLYYSKHYTREMPYSVPYSGYGYPIQYNNIPRQDGHQYARHQPHHGYVNQSGHVDRYNPYNQSGYAGRQYDDNWDILF